LSEGDFALSNWQAWISSKAKTRRVMLPLLGLIFASVIVGVSFYRQPSRTDELARIVSFTCSRYMGNGTFAVDVVANLSDGMDQDEALRVAAKILERVVLKQEMYTRPPEAYSLSAYVHDAGIWTVELDVSYANAYYCRRFLFARIVHERFEVHINPIERTAVYYSTLTGSH